MICPCVLGGANASPVSTNAGNTNLAKTGIAKYDRISLTLRGYFLTISPTTGVPDPE